MKKVFTVICLSLVLSFSVIPTGSAMKASTKECIFLLFSESRANKIQSGSQMKPSEQSKVTKCESRAKKFPKTLFAQFSDEYHLKKSQLFYARRDFMFGSFGNKSVKEALNAVVIGKYPGLSGHLSESVSPSKFIRYYSEAIVYGLELVPSGSLLWNDPLMQTWLADGFPGNKQLLANSLRDDERYGYTTRANLEAIALAKGFACGFGNQSACDSYPAAQARVDALGPLVR